MLLLPHRWLGFALAVFISLVCAAPTSPSPSSSSSPSPPPTQINYVATLFLKDGTKAKTVPNTDPSVWIRIYRLIGELGEDMGDRKGSDGKSLTWGSDIAVEHESADKKSKSVMVYFELEGGQFCPGGRKCYGYIVTLDCIGKGETKRPMQVGAIVTKNLDGSFTVVDYMPRSHVTEVTKKRHRDAFYEFLEFELVKDWAKELKAEGTVVKMSERLRRPEPATPEPERIPKRKHKDATPAAGAKRLSGATNGASRPLHPAQDASASYTSDTSLPRPPSGERSSRAPTPEAPPLPAAPHLPSVEDIRTVTPPLEHQHRVLPPPILPPGRGVGRS